jgi:SPP1 family predicted phage head-tail adaptor
MQAGDLDRRVDLQKKVITRTSTGAEEWSWVSQRIVWASILPIRGREYMTADHLRSDIEVRIVMRYQRDLSVASTWRAVSENLVYSIKSIIQFRSDRKRLELMCTAGISLE